MQDLTGTPASEEDVARDLGFANAMMMRRWQTELGYRVSQLEEKLRTAIAERNRFRWHGKRMQVVLKKTAELLKGIDNGPPEQDVQNLLLAIEVVNGTGVDWEHKLDHWFEEINREPHTDPKEG